MCEYLSLNKCKCERVSTKNTARFLCRQKKKAAAHEHRVLLFLIYFVSSRVSSVMVSCSVLDIILMYKNKNSSTSDTYSYKEIITMSFMVFM